MKIKNIVMSVVLAVGMLFTLTGCSGSNKPKDIKGFSGNTVDISPKEGDLIATFEIKDYGTIKAVLFPEAAPLGVENFQKLCDSGYYKDLKIHRVLNNFMFQGGSLNGDGTGGNALVNDGKFGIETAQNARHFYGALCYANAAGQNTTQFYIVNDKRSTDTSSIAAAYKVEIDKYHEYAKEYAAAGLFDAADTLNAMADDYQITVDWMNRATDTIVNRYKEKGGAASLDGCYTVFGQVYEGFDVIDSISSAEVTYVVEGNEDSEKSKPVQEIIITDVYVSNYVEG